MTKEALDSAKADSDVGAVLTTVSATPYYPNIWANENISIINGISAGGTLGLSDQKDWYTGSTKASAQISTLVTALYTDELLPSYWTDDIYYTLFINDMSNYWLASRSVTDQYFDKTLHYCIALIYYGAPLPEVQAYSIATSSGGVGGTGTYGVRPVITLTAGTKIDTSDTTANGATSTTALVLK